MVGVGLRYDGSDIVAVMEGKEEGKEGGAYAYFGKSRKRTSRGLKATACFRKQLEVLCPFSHFLTHLRSAFTQDQGRFDLLSHSKSHISLRTISLVAIRPSSSPQEKEKSVLSPLFSHHNTQERIQKARDGNQLPVSCPYVSLL